MYRPRQGDKLATGRVRLIGGLRQGSEMFLLMPILTEFCFEALIAIL
jgi:hypothetical protein